MKTELSNPKVVYDTVLGEPGVSKKLTLGRYALLELVGSPLLTGSEIRLGTLLPTAYIMTAEKEDLKGFNASNLQALIEKIQAWAMDLEDMQFVIDVCEETSKQIMDMNKVSPDNTGSKGNGGKENSPFPVTDSSQS